MFVQCVPLVEEAPLVHVADSEIEYDSAHAEQGQDSVCSPQAVASAPLWDEEVGAVIGMISASDFIHVLRRLRHRCDLTLSSCCICPSVLFAGIPSAYVFAQLVHRDGMPKTGGWI